MAIDLDLTIQRHKTMPFTKKAPQQPLSENSLHIYYGDNWLPLLSSLRSIALPGRLAARMNTSRTSSTTTTTTMTTTATTPNFSRPRKTTHQHRPKLLHKHRTGATTTSTTTSAATRTRKTPSCDTIIQVWDESRADPEHGNGLQIHRLAGGMGIAVCGRYADRPRAGAHVRHDAFLAHLVEGRMEATMLALQARVEAARRRGLRDLRTEICYRDDQTLAQDPTGMLWNSQMVAAEQRLNRRFICRAEGLWGPPRLHAYHVSREKVGMCVSGSLVVDDRLDRVVSVVDF